MPCIHGERRADGPMHKRMLTSTHTRLSYSIEAVMRKEAKHPFLPPER